MPRPRRTRRTREEVAGPAGPPPPRVPPPWYRDVWPWLLALGLVVLAIIGGYVGYEAYQDDEDDEPEVVTVTTGETETETDTSTDTTIETTTTQEEPPEPVEVPDVIGLNHVEAGSTIEGAGLVADSYPVASTEARGTVVAQRPPGGAQLPEGETARMNVALGEGAREVRDLPDVTGPQASDARATLRRTGFTVRTQYRQPPTSEEIGEVLTQQPGPGTSAPDLTQVTIFVGRQ
jgi:beta-lactam-binding protein with PASTA domain